MTKQRKNVEKIAIKRKRIKNKNIIYYKVKHCFLIVEKIYNYI